MKRLAGLLLAIVCAGAAPAGAQIKSFEHIVIVVQENRTPDNLFYALCSTQQCSTSPTGSQYDIQTANWLDKSAQGGTVQPGPVPLANDYDPIHSHTAFNAMCDLNSQTNICAMDGAAKIHCVDCPPDAEFKYVDNSQGILQPYLFLATQYGWANYMFQTNQGPSFPAHQFLFGATSAPSKADDHKGTFASENLKGTLTSSKQLYGCIAQPGTKVQLIDAKGVEGKTNQIYPCFEHFTLADVLRRQSVSWRYYTPGAGDIWSAPDAIRHICRPDKGQCLGRLWRDNVALNPIDVFADLAACKLRGVSWVIPSGQFSDHAKINTGAGPAWVAGIANAIGNSPCRNADNTSYWNSTAILITWDDWGGWYDHEPPKFLPYPEGGYQYGFRVPFMFVSAYTPQGYINNRQEDFGAIARFVEFNFGIPMGKLTFADARTKRNLAEFYNLSNSPRPFVPVPAPTVSAAIHPDKLKLEPPDDD